MAHRHTNHLKTSGPADTTYNSYCFRFSLDNTDLDQTTAFYLSKTTDCMLFTAAQVCKPLRYVSGPVQQPHQSAMMHGSQTIISHHLSLSAPRSRLLRSQDNGRLSLMRFLNFIRNPLNYSVGCSTRISLLISTDILIVCFSHVCVHLHAGFSEFRKKLFYPDNPAQ